MLSGHLELTAARGADGATYLASQSFRAPFHLSKPHWEGRALVVQVVNPTAGILEGDTLRLGLHARAGASVLVSTPSASRVFRMKDGSASSSQRGVVEAGAWLEYSPEPLVPHAGSVFRQSTELAVETGGSLLWCEGLMPGRLARGEAWAWHRLVLDLRLRIGERLVFRERFDESGPSFLRVAEFSGMGQGACFSNWLAVSPALAADQGWQSAIAALHSDAVRVGVSQLRDASAWSLRFIARDSIALRDATAAARSLLAERLPGLQVAVRKL
ncbi:urease accessory protein UreD [Nibricoccus sp. IMCC34717]|uniref:urease accessory protein UreD n=1 Tax=Nibricoccus sp. IMCC34717 TaxID=3034021 RepID=UPI0038514D25